MRAIESAGEYTGKYIWNPVLFEYEIGRFCSVYVQHYCDVGTGTLMEAVEGGRTR